MWPLLRSDIHYGAQHDAPIKGVGFGGSMASYLWPPTAAAAGGCQLLLPTLVILVQFYLIFHPLPHKPKCTLPPFEITPFLDQYTVFYPEKNDPDIVFYWVKRVLTTF
jgi:hypothetical protein